MQIARTAVWIVITAVLVAFIAMNWSERASVNIWPLENGYLLFEWPVGIIALFFFFLGFGPMWLLRRAGNWRMQRRISSLENSVRAAAAAPPIAASTQLEEAAAEQDKPAN
jgi:hypothetical protein